MNRNSSSHPFLFVGLKNESSASFIGIWYSLNSPRLMIALDCVDRKRSTRRVWWRPRRWAADSKSRTGRWPSRKPSQVIPATSINTTMAMELPEASLQSAPRWGSTEPSHPSRLLRAPLTSAISRNPPSWVCAMETSLETRFGSKLNGVCLRWMANPLNSRWSTLHRWSGVPLISKIPARWVVATPTFRTKKKTEKKRTFCKKKKSKRKIIISRMRVVTVGKQLNENLTFQESLNEQLGNSF